MKLIDEDDTEAEIDSSAIYRRWIIEFLDYRLIAPKSTEFDDSDDDNNALPVSAPKTEIWHH